jgi:hypothetical protein
MSTSDDKAGDNKPAIRDILLETLFPLRAGKAYHAEKAKQYGLAEHLVNGLLEATTNVPDTELQPFVPGFQKFKSFIEARTARQPHFDPSSGAIAMVSTATAVSSAAFPDIKTFLDTYVVKPHFWNQTRAEQYAARIAKLDPELGRYYRGISEAFLGLTENAERAAFGLARQCFDHLFQVLVPHDDDVRRSAFFVEKAGEKPLAVSRIERVRYAAATHIKETAQAEFLIEQAKELVTAYDQLQRLHARHALDRNQARAVLQAFIASIDQWIDGLGL